jgi:hypothetical protein
MTKSHAFAVVLAGLVAAPGSSLAASEPTSISTGRMPPCAEVPFGAYDPEAEWQPLIRANPLNPEQLAVVWTQGFFNAAVVARSSDGGETWSQHPVPISHCAGGEARNSLAPDSWLAWATDGTLYVSSLTAPPFVEGVTGLTPGSRVVVASSTDGGETWSAPVVVEDDGLFNDRDAMAADPVEPERLYVVWRKTIGEVTSVFTSRSVDRGVHWTTPQNVYAGTEVRVPNGLDIQVLPDQTVVAAFYVIDVTTADAASEEIALRSTDFGATWSAVPIAVTHGHWPRDPDLRLEAFDLAIEEIGNPVPSLAVGPDGLLVVAWHDAPNHDAVSVWLARSTDGGASYSTPSLIRPATLGQAWSPTAAVGADGTIAVTWYDGRAEKPGDGVWTSEVWMGQSHDQGATWTEQRLAGPFDVRAGFFSVGAYAYGNYFGLTALSGGFGAVFTMPTADPTERSTDVYFSRMEP